MAMSNAYFRNALAEPTARAVAEKLMRGAINQVTRPGHPDGCLLVQDALASNQAADLVRKVLIQVRAAAEASIRERFERAVAEDDLPPGVDPAALARFVWTLNLGIAVQAAGGATRAQLREMAEVAMRCWPSTRPDRYSSAAREPDG